MSLSFLTCKLGITMPCKPVGRIIASYTLARAQNGKFLYKYPIIQWGQPLTDTLFFGIPQDASQSCGTGSCFLLSTWLMNQSLICVVESGLFSGLCISAHELVLMQRNLLLLGRSFGVGVRTQNNCSCSNPAPKVPFLPQGKAYFIFLCPDLILPGLS